MPRDFGADKARTSSGPGKVTFWIQQGRRMKHENEEGETERNDMHCTTPLYRLEPCVSVHTHGNVCQDDL